MGAQDIHAQPIEGSQALLIVDDSLDNLRAYEATLEPLGHDIVAVTSGRDAVHLLSQRQFALVLLDVRMPGLDGFATVEALRGQMHRITPVIFVTGVVDDEEAMRRAYSFGAVDYMVKPINPDVLRGKVRNLLMLYRQSIELERRAGLIIAQQQELVEATHSARRVESNVRVLVHDLRAPLDAVVAGAALLARGTNSKESTATIVQGISHTAARIARIVARLRGHEGIPVGGELPVEPRTSTDLDEICDEIVGETRLAHPECLVVQDGRAGRGCWDGDRLAQALSNLLANCAQHGAVDAPIIVRLRDEGSHAVVEVHNLGSPVPPQILANLAEPAEGARTDGHQARSRLGLYITREIVAAHGGTIGVRSDDTDGTTFTVRLPRHRPHARA
jgi:two-component system sensor histidine kinase/response regulator